MVLANDSFQKRPLGQILSYHHNQAVSRPTVLSRPLSPVPLMNGKALSCTIAYCL